MNRLNQLGYAIETLCSHRDALRKLRDVALCDAEEADKLASCSRGNAACLHGQALDTEAAIGILKDLMISPRPVKTERLVPRMEPEEAA